MKLKEAMAELKDGEAVTITASDCAFAADVKGWCHSTGNELVSLDDAGGKVRATVAKKTAGAGGCGRTGEDNRETEDHRRVLERSG